MLCKYAIKSGVHVINGSTSDNLSNLLHMVLDLDVSLISAMCAINWIVEDVAIEPLCIVESDIKSKLFLSALFSDPDMTNFRDRLSIELVSGSYLSLIGLKNGVCVVIVLWLMRRPLNNQDWSLSDHIYKHILSSVYK